MGGVDPGQRHRSHHGEDPQLWVETPTMAGTPATARTPSAGRDLDRGRGPPPRAGVHPDPRSRPPSVSPHRTSLGDRQTCSSASRGHKCAVSHFSLPNSPRGEIKRARASTPSTPLRGGQGPGGARPLPEPPRAPSRTYRPAAIGHGPHGAAFFRGRSCQRPPERLTFPSQTAAHAVPTAGSEPGPHTFPGRRARRGGGAAPWRARAKLQHKRPMAGSARRPGQAPPPLPALGAAASCASRAPAALSARPRNAQPGAPGGPRGRSASKGRTAAAGLCSRARRTLLAGGV